MNLLHSRFTAVLERGAENTASLDELVEAVEAYGLDVWSFMRLRAALVRGDTVAASAALEDLSRELEASSDLEDASPSTLRLLAALGETVLARRFCEEAAAAGVLVRDPARPAHGCPRPGARGGARSSVSGGRGVLR